MNRNNDLHWMSLALSLAEKGKYAVSPNPMVGACIVRNGKLIASGYHRAYGFDHAEVHAFKKAGLRAKGADLYVTLEPCSHWGKTPPCTSAIIEAGIKRVFIASLDPNPINHQKSVLILKKAGIEVKSGILQKESAIQNESFLKWIQTGRPFVTLKMAQSLDGKIATYTGQSRWITCPESREFVHRLRAEQDAVLVGKNTWQKDNPFLSPRFYPGKPYEKMCPEKPWRFILDPHLEAKPSLRFFQGDQLSFQVISKKQMSKVFSKSSGLRKRNILPVSEKKGKLSLKELLQKMGAMGVAKLLVEGGGELAWSLLEENLVDRIYWMVAPILIGGREAKTSVEGHGVQTPDFAFRPKRLEVSKLGADWLFQGEMN